jgi:hypothetical protein
MVGKRKGKLSENVAGFVASSIPLRRRAVADNVKPQCE